MTLMRSKARPSYDGRVVARAVAFVILSFAVTGLADAQPVNDPATRDPKNFESVQQVCTGCHDAARVMHSRSWGEWSRLLERMSEFGAKGTDAQWDGISAFLQQNLSLLNVNAAPAEELGPVLDIKDDVAAAIMARRGQRKFSGYADLAAVPGINQKRLEQIKDRLSY